MRLLRLSLIAASLILTGCASSPPESAIGSSHVVSSQLNQQLSQWHGTPYRYGGHSRSGVDCSGFVQITFKDRFNSLLPRTTAQQAQLGEKITKNQLQSGDLVFFKTGRGENGLHVGIYDRDGTFIHASTSKGVIRSSMETSYWKKHFWQARRL